MLEFSEEIDELIQRIATLIVERRAEGYKIEGEIYGLEHSKRLYLQTRHQTIQPDPIAAEIDANIRQAQRRAHDLRIELDKLEGELSGLRAARTIVTGEEQAPSRDTAPPHKRTEISAPWRKILSHFVSKSPNAVSIDDVMIFIHNHNLEIGRNAVRSQLHNYAQRGFIKRIRDGLYVATDAVKRVC